MFNIYSMATSYYLKYLKKGYRIEQTTSKGYKNLFNYLKTRLQNENYKWQTALFDNMVRESNLNYDHVVFAMSILNQNYLKKTGKRHKLFNDYLLVLKNRDFTLKGAFVSKEKREKFIKDIFSINKEYFNKKDSTVFDFINENFDTGLNRNSLENLYYQKIQEK